MKSIEEIKIELTLKILNGTFDPWEDIENLPTNDDLRTFVCSISPESAYLYASKVDGRSHSETRTVACKCDIYAYYYASFVDYRSHNETREGAYRHPGWKKAYIDRFGD